MRREIFREYPESARSRRLSNHASRGLTSAFERRRGGLERHALGAGPSTEPASPARSSLLNFYASVVSVRWSASSTSMPRQRTIPRSWCGRFGAVTAHITPAADSGRFLGVALCYRLGCPPEPIRHGTRRRHSRAGVAIGLAFFRRIGPRTTQPSTGDRQSSRARIPGCLRKYFTISPKLARPLCRAVSMSTYSLRMVMPFVAAYSRSNLS
jgi:hypothetical protein